MTGYSLPEDATRRLEGLVDRIEAAPGSMIDHDDFEGAYEGLNVRGVIQTLPEGLSEDDLAGILKLALLTECATDSYAREISARAREHDAGWLARFNENVWTPDELTHHAPYKAMLMSMGFSEAELDAEVRETQEKEYEHFGGETPVHVSTFGMVQEYLTDHWHGLIGRLLKPAAPRAAHMANQVKKRETLHTVWYRDMTALQVEANPAFFTHVADEVARFRMPGNSLVPDLQVQSVRWLPLMGADLTHVVRDMIRLLYSTVGSPRLGGQLALDLAGRKGVKLGPLKHSQVTAALNALGGWGYGLIGEAMLERAGLAYLFEAQGPRAQSPPQKVRALFRSWLADRIPLQFYATEPSPAHS